MATLWGCDHGEQAGKEHERRISNQHINFQMSKSGFIIPLSYPIMGAFPDGIKCKCYGDDTLEIN